jgi:RNA polymerase sigma-70 factor (ECF subfamily)
MNSSTNQPVDYENTPDVELMLMVGRGQRRAFEILIQRHQRGVVNFFRRMGVHNDETDLAQETFVKIYKYRKRYRPRAKFTTFLYLVARRILMDYGRKRQREKAGTERLIEETLAAEPKQKDISDQAARAAESLQGLSEEMRSVVVLNIYQGLRYRDIAEVLGIPLGTVKTRMFHALKKLREAL